MTDLVPEGCINDAVGGQEDPATRSELDTAIKESIPAYDRLIMDVVDITQRALTIPYLWAYLIAEGRPYSPSKSTPE